MILFGKHSPKVLHMYTQRKVEKRKYHLYSVRYNMFCKMKTYHYVYQYSVLHQANGRSWDVGAQAIVRCHMQPLTS